MSSWMLGKAVIDPTGIGQVVGVRRYPLQEEGVVQDGLVLSVRLGISHELKEVQFSGQKATGVYQAFMDAWEVGVSDCETSPVICVLQGQTWRELEWPLAV